MSIIHYKNQFTEDNGDIIESYAPWNYKYLGVFDSMLTIHGAPQDMNYHLERLNHDIKTVLPGISLSIDHNETAKIYQALLEKNNLTKDHARIRTSVAMDGNEPILIICTLPASKQSNTPLICAVIESYPREAGNPLENCKRLNYSRNFSARHKAEKLGATEAILINTNGDIACGATSNIFIEENGVLTTPPLRDGVLAGVTRRKIIEEKDVHEESISPERLQNADASYLTNSFIGLQKIQKIL